MIDEPVMVITGTTRGIGRYMVDYYIEKGYHVVGCGRSELPEAPAEHYEHHTLDVSDEGAVVRMFTDIRQRLGRVDALLNNAGIAAINFSLTTPLKQFNKIFATNTVGTFLFTREAAKVMQLRRYGRIINFSSAATPLKIEGESAYAASKAAIVTLTHIHARELAGLNITVNCVGPGPIKTALLWGVPEHKLEDTINKQAIKRFGTFEDVVNVVDFFLQSESEFITSQVIYLGGVV